MAAPVPYPQSDFGGGLMLRDGVTLLDERYATDLENVRFSRRGDLRRRNGFSMWNEDVRVLASLGRGMHHSLVGVGDHILVGGYELSTFVHAISSTGSMSQSVNASAEPHSFCDFGDPNTERTYFANGYDFGYWSGAAWTLNPTVEEKATEGTASFSAGQAAPRPRVLVVTPWDNRLMCVGYRATSLAPAAQASSPSQINFSMPGNPLQFVRTARILMSPGDGEELVAAVRWRDLVFVFKQTKFFVFYGTATDGQGLPEFQYSTVDAGVGAFGRQGVCVAADGVYFIAADGVYRTTGAEPEKVSDAIDPLFVGGELISYGGGEIVQSGLARAALVAVGREVFVSVPTHENPAGTTYPDATLVYDRESGAWMRDSYGFTAGCRARRSGRDVLVVGASTYDGLGLSDGGPRYFDVSADEDVFDPIDAYWRSGWATLGSDTEKTIRRTQFWGRGTILYSHGFDYESLYEVGEVDFDLVLPPWPSGGVDEVWPSGGGDETWPVGPARRYANIMLDHGYRGEVYAFEIANVDGADFAVQRLEHHVKQRSSAAVQTHGG